MFSFVVRPNRSRGMSCDEIGLEGSGLLLLMVDVCRRAVRGDPAIAFLSFPSLLSEREPQPHPGEETEPSVGLFNLRNADFAATDNVSVQADLVLIVHRLT